jgi:hypothetical protein
MNVNFGLFPPLPDGALKKPEGHEGRWRGKDKAIAKKRALTDRAKRDAACLAGKDAAARGRGVALPMHSPVGRANSSGSPARL